MDYDRYPLPPGVVTGIGSLPFHDPQQALALIAEQCPELPFWPQLPQRSPNERIIEQALAPFEDRLQPREQGSGYVARHVDDVLRGFAQAKAELLPTHAAGFFAFEEALAAGLFSEARMLKGQMVGPITLASQLFVGDTCLLENDTVVDAASAYCERLACWQVERLKRWDKPVMIFLDEPCITMIPWSPDETQTLPPTLTLLANVIQAIQNTGVLVGIHSCATPERVVHASAMSRLNPDILSFDAYHGVKTFFRNKDALQFVEDGGIVAFGLVPTLQDMNDVDPYHLFSRWQVASYKVVTNRAELGRQSMITASCGLGLLPEAAVRDSFEIAHSIERYIASFVANI